MIPIRHIAILLLVTFFIWGCISPMGGDEGTYNGTSVLSQQHYDVYFTGSKNNVSPTTRGGLVLAGGGTGHDEALAWFVNQAGYGDIIVIRASGSDGYNKQFAKMGANSVASIVIKSRDAAMDPSILDRLKNAEGIFFAGGDQSYYAKFLSGTALAREVNFAAERGVPVGGSSAGLAILGEFYFPAYKDTVTSRETLADPYDNRVILEKELLSLPFLDNLITDSHFRDRDRMGRLITFMARILSDKWANHVRGVGLDENVALAIAANGNAQVFAKSGHVYLLETTSTPNSCAKSKPLTFNNVKARRLSGSTKFNFKDWADAPGHIYTLDVVAGTIKSSEGAIY